MRRMKKLMALCLAVALVGQSGFPSFATEGLETPAVVSSEDEVANVEETDTTNQTTPESVPEEIQEGTAKQPDGEENPAENPEETKAPGEAGEAAAPEETEETTEPETTGETKAPGETEAELPTGTRGDPAVESPTEGIKDPALETELVENLLTPELLTASPEEADVVEEEMVARIGDKDYATLDEAVSEAEDGDIILVLGDCSLSKPEIKGKILTIQGIDGEFPTISFKEYGIHAVDSKLEFKNCKLDMNISDNSSHSGGTANLIDDSDFILDAAEITLVNDRSDTAGESGIYLYQGSNLYLYNGSKVEISGFNDDDSSSGIYADNSEYSGMPNRKIIVSGGSSLSVHDCGWHGMTINPVDITVSDKSSVTLMNNGNTEYGGGLGCYYGKLTVEKESHFIADSNTGVGWGIFVKELLVDGTSELSASHNVGDGLTIGGEGLIASGAKVTLNDNDGAGLRVYLGSNYWFGNIKIEADANVSICENRGGGIYNANILDMNAGVVMENHTKSSGGGIYNKKGAKATIGNAVALYNNHADLRGDDIYLEGSTSTLTFNEVGSDWYLDGAPDCEDGIDGWYYDGQVGTLRWNAHEGNSYYAKQYVLKEGMETVQGTLALKAAHGLKPGEVLTPPDIPDSEWTVSRSKTAENLNENQESKVTLSLPSYEETLVTDVVFVLDESSCTEPVKAEVARILESLYAQITKSNATIKIGAVQFRGEVMKFELTKLSADTRDEVTEFMSTRPSVRGSNLSAGLLAGEEMLDADTSVSADRKYLILVSDGITYIWDDESTAQQENYGVNFANGDSPATPMLAGPDGWDVKYGNGYVPDNWSEHLTSVGKLLNTTIQYKSSLYEHGENETAGKNFVSYTEKDNYVSTVDIALYKSYEVYQSIASKYSHTYAVTAGVEREIATFPFGVSFIKYLAGGEEVSFDTILNEIIYLVDEGSYVEDYIGYVENDYNFDLVNDAAALNMTVGGVSYQAVKLSQTDETTVYGFVPQDDADHPYAYTLTYYPGKLAGDEYFRWDIYVPVTNFKQVQLTYTVKLANPKTAAGTYGIYDADGSKNDGSSAYSLYTNNSATLYPVDTNGNAGDPQAFAKPTVSYTVKASEPEPSKPDDQKPDDSDDHHSGSDDSDDGDDGNSSDPTPVGTPASVSAATTGDSNNILLPLLGILLAAALLGGYGVRMYKKRKRS